MPSETDTKQVILAAAIRCIEAKGLNAVTVRDIAAESQTNVAAVNYHFGSKDALLARAMQATVDNTMPDMAELLADDSRSVTERLRDLFVYLIEGARRYPNLTRAHLYGPLMRGEPQGPFLDALMALVGDLLDRTPETELPLPLMEMQIATGLALTNALMLGIAPQLVPDLLGETGAAQQADRLMARFDPERAVTR